MLAKMVPYPFVMIIFKLNQRIGFFRDMKNVGPPLQQVEDVLVPTAVKPFPSRVVSASLGLNHSGVLLENGQVHLFGHNGNGELGMGNKQPMPNNCTRPVKALLEKACVVGHSSQFILLFN
jgi:alpha-tubulin suppressor-like RCC1 family protein